MGPSKPPAKAEREWMDRARDYGCLACKQDGHSTPASLHHITSGFRRADRDSWLQQASDRAQDALDLVAAERERWAQARELATLCAAWHVQDSDECGQIARELLALLWA